VISRKVIKMLAALKHNKQIHTGGIEIQMISDAGEKRANVV
jgi:hypothetical protein